MRGYLAIKNIGLFSGCYFGWDGPCSGEVAHFHSRGFCWDILTDPAYHKKIVITDKVYVEDKSPLSEDSQSFMPHLSAIVFLGSIRKSSLSSSSSDEGLEEYLRTNRITGFIPDRKDLLFDTLRFVSCATAGLAPDPGDALDGSRIPATYNTDDLKWVSIPQEYLWDLSPIDVPEEKHNIVVWDFGTGYGLLRTFRKNGCRIRVVPPYTPPEDIVALHPDGIIISGSPLSPSSAREIIPRVERVIGIRPILGVGGGAITLAEALGIEISELENPHHGSAIPVETIGTGRISATYQTHSLTPGAISVEKAGCAITDINVCDESVEGFINDEYNIIGALYSDAFGESPAYLAGFNQILEKSATNSL